METEEEAREATDGQEVRMEAVDLGTDHLQTHLDGKFSSNKETKDEAKIMDSTEGMLKIPEDQNLAEAPSEVEIPPELNLNGTTSSLNGHMVKEEKISNEQPHENDKEDKEKVEVSPDGTCTDQSNKSNDEEVIDSLGLGESTTEDTSLPKHENEEHKEHGQQDLEGDVMDDKMVHKDTMKTDNAIEPTVDPQQDQNLESAKATEDTQPASMSNILDDEVVAEAPVGVQTLEPNVDDSDALPDTIDGNTEIVEPAKADDVAHLDHKESSPQDKDSAEHTDEMAEVDDQHRKQTNAVDADVVQEETSKTKEIEDPNVDDSDALPDTIEGITEIVEPANRADDVAHLDHKESSPEDKDSAERTDEVAEVDDQHSKQTDVVDVDVVQEETSKTKETEDPNVDDSDALPDTIDGNTETVEPARTDDVAHLDHKESSPEDKDSAEHTDEVAQVDDQHSKQTDAVDAGVVQEETSKTKETEDPNVDDSDALPDTIDGNTEIVEPARADDVAHLDHKESSPEEKDSAEHTGEVAEVDDQRSKQTDAVDADVVQEEISKSKETEDPNVDDSDALPDTIDGNTETVEPARADDVAHLDHKESSPQDKDSAEHTDEVAEVDDQHIKQTDAVDADVVQEETSKTKETEDPNVDDSDALPDTIDGNTETVEPTRADDVAHLDHKESSPEEKDSAEHTDEVAEVDDQHSKQTDAVDADVVQEETSKTKETEDPNVDDSDGILDTIDGNIETVEPARADDVAHVDHKESSPEEKDSAEHTGEVAEVDDQHSKQTDAVDADVVQEETSKTKETEDPNVDDSDALSDTIDGNTETVEPAKADDVPHLNHKESSPEDKDSAEHTDDLAEVDDQHSMQTDAVDAAVVQEETSKTKETEDPNVDDSDALPDTIDGNTETVEPAKADDVAHLNHKESSPEDKDSAEHTDEVAKVDDQHSKQTDAVDVDVVQEETSKCKEAEDPNVDDSDALPDTIDGNTETIEPARADDVAHLDHKENSQEDKDSAEHTDEVAEEDDQHSKQTDVVDADVVQEDTSKTKETEDPNVDDSDALPDTIDGNTETVEPARVDDVAHLDHKESSSEDEDIEEHTDDVAEVEDRHSKQTDAVDADIVQEEIPKSMKTEVQEEMPKTEQADDSTIDAHVLDQELPEETNDPVYEKTEETFHQSSVAASKETTPEHVAMREPAVNIQEVQNQGSVEEMIDAEALDTEKTMQQSSAAFEEEIPEDNVATTAPSSDIQHVHNVESEEIKALDDAKAEESSNGSNVAFAEDAVQDKVLPSEPTLYIQPVQGSEQEETENTGTVEMDEASNQTHGAVQNNLAQEDGIPASEPHVTELAEEVKDIEATEIQEITHQCHAVTSKELSTEDNSTASEPHNDDIQQALEQDSAEVKDIEAAEAQGICHERTTSTSEEDTVEHNATEGPTCDTQEVQSVESPEEIKEDIADNIVEASNATTVDEADQENNVLVSEAIAEQQTRGLEPEEIKNTEPVEIEASDQRHAALFSDLAQEDNTTVNEMQKTEPTVETKENEATKNGAIPQESNASISEEPTPKDNMTASETTSDTQEGNNVGSLEAIEGNKDAKTEEISDHSNESFAVEAAQGNNTLGREANADIQPVQELELEGMTNTKLVAVSETSHQMDDAVFQKPTQEDKTTASELHVMESEGEVSNIEATEAQATPHQTNLVQSEGQVTEENTTASEPQIPEPESVEEMKDTDPIEPQGISQQSIISTSEESVPEENVTAKDPAYDNKVQNEEPELIKEHDDVKAEEISSQSNGPIVGEAAQENNLLASETTNDVQVNGLESKEIRNTEDIGTEEASHQTNVAAVEENMTASEPQMIESSEQMNDIGPEPTLHENNIASIEEMATEDNITIGPDVGIQQLQEQESVQFKEIEATEPQGISPSHIVSTSEESTKDDNVTTTEPSSDTQAENLESAEVIKDTKDVKSNVDLAEEATPEEHVLATETTIDVPPVQERELKETKNTEPVETQDNITASDLPAEEVKDTEARETEAIPRESTVASISELTEDVKSNVGISELTEDVKSNVALPDEAAPKEHVLATEATVDTPQVQEPELEEVKNTEPAEVKDIITASDLPAEEMKDTETMETEAIPHESTVASIKELTEDGILTASPPHGDIQQVLEQESVEDMKCTDTTEYQGEPQQSIVSTSDEHTPTEEKTTVTEPTRNIQVQNVIAQEIKDSEDVKTEEFSDRSTFSTPEVVAQESAVLRSELTSDAQQVQEQDSTEETRGIEAVETEDRQQHGVSTLEKPVPENNVTESEPKVDDQQVQEEKSVVEVKDIESMETEEISDQSNITTSENAAQESSELRSDPDFYVQPAQLLELDEGSKGSQLVKAEQTGESNFAILEEPTAEDNATNEVGPPADIKQEHELESVEEIKHISATEAEEAFDASQVAALEEPPSESNIATTEPTYDIQQVNDSEATNEMKATEAINDEEISCQQTEIAVFEDQSSTEKGTPPEKLPVESNKENFGNEIDNVMLVHEKIKDEIQESTELKDEASNLGEKTAFTTQKGENITEVDAVQISGEDTIETSHNIDKIKEKPKAVTEHDSSQMSSDQREENVTHVQDRDIKGELLTESDTEEISQASFENDPQAAQDVAENDDTIKSGEQTNDQDNEQHHDLVLQMQVCERSMDALSIGQQDEDVQKVNLDQQQKEGEEIEAQMEQIQTDEQKHDDKRADFTTDSLVEPQSIEVVTNRTEDTDVFEGERTETVVTEMLKNEHTLHVPQESIPRITDMNVENITERKEGTEGENEPNNAGPLDADAENYNEDEQENTEKDAVAAKASTDEQYETTDEIRNEEVEAGLSSSVEKDLQEISDPAPSNDEIQENVSGENLATTEHNGVEAEAMQQKVDSPNAETNNDDILSTSNPLPEHESGTASDINQNRRYQEAINADDVLQLKPEENAFDKIDETDSNEKMETSYTAATETVTFDEDICDKASGADGALSDESLKTFEDTRRNLDVSSVITASKGESINKEMEDHKLALPAQPTLDKNTTEQASSLEETERELLLPEKPLPAEPEEQEENQMAKEQDEEDMHEPEIGDTQKDAEESDLPVSNFLMNLILGKESNDPNRNSESEVEKKQEETMKDDSCLIASQQEESSVSFPAENKVDDKLIFEQEKQNVEGSEETDETVKEQSHDFKLDTERSLETDEELNWNTHDSDAPVYQDNAQDEISSELVPGEATGLVTETETRDFELDEKAVDTICQEDVEATAQIEEGSLKNNLDDSTSPKASQEDTLEEGRTELLHESLPEDRSSGAVAEQTLSLTEPDMGDAEKMPNDTYGLQSPLCTEQEESIDFSNVEAKSTIEVQLESEEVDKKEENQHSATGGSTEEQTENLHDNSQKGTGSEAISDEQAREITEPVSSTDKNLAHEREISAGSTCMDEKESYNFSNNEKALEIQSDGPNLHINQDKRDESTVSQIVIEKNYFLEKPAESNLQEQQETDTARKSPKETDEGYQKILVIKETVIKEENVHETVKGHVQTENIKPNEEQEPDSHVQERALDVVSPKEGNEVEESFVEITKQGFSTDKEQSPKADESNMAEEKTYDEKTKDEEEAKNFTDEATMKIEGKAGQKASHKKHNILSSVGSKVKHQIAKVKKAIIGKPGHTKSESPKS